jgi:hypothetical protein
LGEIRIAGEASSTWIAVSAVGNVAVEVKLFWLGYFRKSQHVVVELQSLQK